MSYIALADAAEWGLAGATQPMLDAATALVNAYLRRPEGVVWAPDAAGAPCYMAGLTPTRALALSDAIVAGQAATVAAPRWVASQDLLGEVFVVDRDDADRVEALVVSGVTETSITFEPAAFDHDAGASLEAGLVLLEERHLPSKRPIMRITRGPAVRLLSGRGRYGFGRRTDQALGIPADYGLITSLQFMGGPPSWIGFDVHQASVSDATGEVWIPAGVYGASFTEVRLRYVAGWSQANLPPAILSATAAAAAAILDAPEMTGNIKIYQAGGTKVERFADDLLDAASRAALEPYRAHAFG